MARDRVSNAMIFFRFVAHGVSIMSSWSTSCCHPSGTAMSSVASSKGSNVAT